MKRDNELSKIGLDLKNDDNSGFSVEWVWGIKVGDMSYIIDNSPYHAYGISLGDQVKVEDREGNLFFCFIEKRGGHSTYRIKLPIGRDHEFFLKFWPDLEIFGCTYEGMSGENRVYSIDIPDTKSVADAYAVLERNEKAGIWEFEEGHYCGPGGN